MIRNDIKLTEIEKEKLFGKHGLEFTGYLSGKVGDEELVMNEKTGEIMDYYFDDSTDEWIDLSEFKVLENKKIKINSGLYEFNIKTYKLRNKITKKEKTERITDQKIKITTLSLNNKSFNVSYHRLICSLKPNINPKERCVVDHINHDSLDNSINNLHWVTILENTLNKVKPEKRIRYYSYKDLEHITPDKIYNSEEELIKDGYFPENIYRSIKENKPYKGLYWDKENIKLTSYLDHLGLKYSDIEDKDFIFNPIFGIHVNTKLGLFKFKQNKITCGSIGARTRTYRITINKKYYIASRVIMSTILGCIELNGDLIVDHINTDPQDNRGCNLKVGTQKDNMNNLNTKKKFQKHLINKDGKIFDSIKEAALYYKKAKFHFIDRYVKTGFDGLSFYEENAEIKE